MKTSALLCIFAMALYLPSSYAQNERNFVYDSLSEKMSQELKASLKALNDPENMEANAKYIRGLYEALVEQGFSKKEAMTLVAASLSGRQKL
ncbi:MAG: hypothetical protein Alis3KO_36300 [Aliiglaciecola sp.]